MFYYLLTQLTSWYSGFNLFRYITVRSFLAFFTGFVLTLGIGPWFIRFLRVRQFTQTIRTDGPATHLAKKNTPTMGGIIILVALLVSALSWAQWNRFVLLSAAAVVYLGALGFLDDYLKVIRRHHGGVPARIKLVFQLIAGAALCGYLAWHPSSAAYPMHLQVPYLKETIVYLGAGYFVIVLLAFIGSSNGVNLTDGLDGLAVGNMTMVAVTFAVLAYVAGNAKLAEYLRIVYVPGAGELTVLLAALAGVCLGFLWFNSHPAAVFMGDTGSLFLGGLIGLVAVFIRQELLLVVAGGVFVVEVLSVMLQVTHYRRTGKRIFRMAPLHHHFEVGGMPEGKVTVRFWIVGVLLAMLTLASLKVR